MSYFSLSSFLFREKKTTSDLTIYFNSRVLIIIVLHGCKISLPGGFSVLRATYAADPGPLEKDRLLGDMLYSAISRQGDQSGVPGVLSDGYSDTVSTVGSLMDRSDTGDSIRTLDHPNASAHRISTGMSSISTDHTSRSSTQSTSLSTSEADENFYNLPPYAQYQLRQQRAAAAAEGAIGGGVNTSTMGNLSVSSSQLPSGGSTPQANSMSSMRDFQSSDSSISGGSSPSSLQQQSFAAQLKRNPSSGQPTFDIQDGGILPPGASIDSMQQQGDASQRGGQWGNPRGLSGQPQTDMAYYQPQRSASGGMPQYPGMSQSVRPRGFIPNQGIPPNALPVNNKMHHHQQQAFDHQLYQHHLMMQQQHQRSQLMGHDHMRMQQQQQQRYGGGSYPGYAPGPPDAYASAEYTPGMMLPPQDPSSYIRGPLPPQQQQMAPNNFAAGPLGNKPYDSGYQGRGTMSSGPLPMMRRFPDGPQNGATYGGMRDGGAGYYTGPNPPPLSVLRGAMPNFSSLGEPTFPGDERNQLASLGKDTSSAIGDIGIPYLPGQGSTGSGKSWSDFSGSSPLVSAPQTVRGEQQTLATSSNADSAAPNTASSNSNNNSSPADERANDSAPSFFSTSNKDAPSSDDSSANATGAPPSRGLATSGSSLGLSPVSTPWATGQELSSSASNGSTFPQQQQQQQQQHDPDTLGLSTLSIGDGSATFSWPATSSSSSN
jgi:hypothetical protein